MKTINIAPKIEKAGCLVVGIIAAMASLFLSVVSLMHTTVVDDVKEGEGVMSVVYNIPERLECVYYLNDNFILNLLILAVLLLDAFLLIRHCKKNQTADNLHRTVSLDVRTRYLLGAVIAVRTD